MPGTALARALLNSRSPVKPLGLAWFGAALRDKTVKLLSSASPVVAGEAAGASQGSGRKP